jgi:hypothetical protein
VREGRGVSGPEGLDGPAAVWAARFRKVGWAGKKKVRVVCLFCCFFSFFFNSFLSFLFKLLLKTFSKILNQLLNHTISQKPMHST